MQDIIIRISVDVLPISLFDTTWTLLFSSMLLHLSPSPSTSNNIITVHNKLFGCGFIANHHCCFKISHPKNNDRRETNKQIWMLASNTDSMDSSGYLYWSWWLVFLSCLLDEVLIFLAALFKACTGNLECLDSNKMDVAMGGRDGDNYTSPHCKCSDNNYMTSWKSMNYCTLRC